MMLSAHRASRTHGMAYFIIVCIYPILCAWVTGQALFTGNSKFI